VYQRQTVSHQDIVETVVERKHDGWERSSEFHFFMGLVALKDAAKLSATTTSVQVHVARRETDTHVPGEASVHPLLNMLLESWRVRSQSRPIYRFGFSRLFDDPTHVANIMRAEPDHHYSAAVLYLLLQDPTFVHAAWRTHRLRSCCRCSNCGRQNDFAGFFFFEKSSHPDVEPHDCRLHVCVDSRSIARTKLTCSRHARLRSKV
jgi:hypothetical protein